ncbi:MAG TPA: hypothetical protein ENN67_09175, partial [Firmicutes bacterium]|nr:hypothetical protein [Bacillota bacterium]
LQGGGGLLQDVTSSRSLAYYLSIQLAGFITGRRVIIFGQGIGPLEGELSPWFVGGFLSHCDLVIVRDFKSYAFAQSRMPITADVRLMADPALLLEPADQDRVDDIFLQENLDLLGKPLFACTLKGPLKDRRQITSLARAIDIACDTLDCGIALLPFHHPSDLEYAEAIHALVKDKEYCSVVKGKYSPSEMLGLIGKFDLVVGMRLHSLIFAANRAVPFVPVSYDPKIDEFAGEFGMKPAVHTPLIGPERLVEAIEDAWEFRGRIKTRITEGMTKLAKRASDGFEGLGEYFDRLNLWKLGMLREMKDRSRRKGKRTSEN